MASQDYREFELGFSGRNIPGPQRSNTWSQDYCDNENRQVHETSHELLPVLLRQSAFTAPCPSARTQRDQLR